MQAHHFQEAGQPEPSFDVAHAFLTALAGDTAVNFRLYSDDKSKPFGQSLYGSLAERWNQLASANVDGMAVGVMVNRTANGGSKGADVDLVRALFVDLDGAPLGPVQDAELTPHIIVETSPSKYHAYWLVDGLPLDRFRGAQQALARYVHADEAICDLGRVMRLPGFLHTKNPDKPFASRVIFQSHEPHYSAGQVLKWVESLAPVQPDIQPPVRRAPLAGTRPAGVLVGLYQQVQESEIGHRNATLNRAAFHAGCEIERSGLDRDTTEANLLAAGRQSGLDECEVEDVVARGMEAGIRRAFQGRVDDLDEAARAVEDLNTRHAVVQLDSKVAVAKIPDDHGQVTFNGRQDFFDWYANQAMDDPDSGRPSTVARVWFRHPCRRQCPGVSFAPGDAALPDGYLNLWRGWGLLPRPGNCDLYKRLLKEAICGGNDEVAEYVWKYLAHLVQRPHELPGTALVLRGPQGTGKSCFVKLLRPIVGNAHYLDITNHEHLCGRFNGHMSARLVLVINEASWGGYTKDNGIVKALVTEPLQVIERKHVAPIVEANYKRCFFLSNNDWVVGMDADDRRFVTLEVSPVLRDEPGFFDRFHEELAAGGDAALLYELLAVDLTGFNPTRRPKATSVLAAALEQKLSGLGVAERFWYDALNRGTISLNGFTHYLQPEVWPDSILVTELNQQVQHSARRYRDSVPNPATVGRRLHDMCPSLCKRRGSNGSKRIQEYALPPLARARVEFEQYIRSPVEWDTLADE